MHAVCVDSVLINISPRLHSVKVGNCGYCHWTALALHVHVYVISLHTIAIHSNDCHYYHNVVNGKTAKKQLLLLVYYLQLTVPLKSPSHMKVIIQNLLLLLRYYILCNWIGIGHILKSNMGLIVFLSNSW